MPATPPAKRSKTKRLAHDRLVRLLYEASAEEDITLMEEVRRQVPDAWHLIEMDIDVIAPKEKITLYLDRAVARCFRAMGAGYQARINRILETWVQLKMAEIREVEMTMTEALRPTITQCKAPEKDNPETAMLKDLAETWAYKKGFEDGQAAEESGD